MASKTTNQARSKGLDAGTVRNVNSNSRIHSANVAYFQKKIQFVFI